MLVHTKSLPLDLQEGDGGGGDVDIDVDVDMASNAKHLALRLACASSNSVHLRRSELFSSRRNIDLFLHVIPTLFCPTVALDTGTLVLWC